MTTLAAKEAKDQLVQHQQVDRPVVPLLQLIMQLMGRGGRHVVEESRIETLKSAQASLNKMTGNQ
mgnify:CR=1 FL=1